MVWPKNTGVVIQHADIRSTNLDPDPYSDPDIVQWGSGSHRPTPILHQKYSTSEFFISLI